MLTMNMVDTDMKVQECPGRRLAESNDMGPTATDAATCVMLLQAERDYAGALEAAHACLSRMEHAHQYMAARSTSAPEVLQAWIDRLLAFIPDVKAGVELTHGDVEGARFVLTQYAPQGLLAGCVLQNIAHAGNCHETVALLGHRVHAWQAGEGDHARHHAVCYRRLLEQAGIYLPEISSERLASQVDMLAASWSLPAYRLSLAMFPARRQAEAIGAALFEVALGVPACIADAERALSTSLYSSVRATPRRNEALNFLRQAVEAIVGPAGTASPHADQVARGFMQSLQIWRQWCVAVHAEMHGNLRSARQAMVRMVAEKGRFAVGYHSRIKMQGQPFDELVVRDPVAFVEALGHSRWIRPGKPESSLLLTRLIAFGGPMFRIFSDAEIGVITRWITEMAEPAPCHGGSPVQRATPGLISPAPPQRPFVGAKYRPEARARALYHQLLNIEEFPQAHQEALRYALVWLGRCAGRRGCDAAPPPSYTQTAFRQWFESRALRQVAAYTLTDGAVGKSREEVVDEAVQICPMILADGAWIQRWTHAGLADTPVGALLYKIFSDEIGNGVEEYNHPNIYRDLMREMGVALPDFRSSEFSSLPIFDNDAFLVPAFWLSISLFPRRFLPETLGLNLAMELSGVGGAYRTASAELRHYGFSTLFVDLHNTIDNVSSGHSAMAAEAIELYMDSHVCSATPESIDRHWRRIRTGFLALSPPKAGWREWFAPPLYVV
ncbi:iron-containing redox enzyme family protein [Janthinobacterium agaricidamnosum]|uniref:Iron-containing redox enzyme family protein n=1 Tax=Janthinobacterium agaricidamnosum NBRC 102515 = DSM 9628 TaxID=1349767 RepID=W0V5H1_9BURK|nr:iron-containing redox enzyme family protein [Janthinobacterium agaricidamnosum]CDG83131.1 putative uncharacterized protein [Janthinobacterium agaricidamnosum NBRC 102515 = DSM 9628]